MPRLRVERRRRGGDFAIREVHQLRRQRRRTEVDRDTQTLPRLRLQRLVTHQNRRAPLLHLDRDRPLRHREAAQSPAAANLVLAERRAHFVRDRHLAFDDADPATAAQQRAPARKLHAQLEQAVPQRRAHRRVDMHSLAHSGRLLF